MGSYAPSLQGPGRVINVQHSKIYTVWVISFFNLLQKYLNAYYMLHSRHYFSHWGDRDSSEIKVPPAREFSFSWWMDLSYGIVATISLCCLCFLSTVYIWYLIYLKISLALLKNVWIQTHFAWKYFSGEDPSVYCLCFMKKSWTLINGPCERFELKVWLPSSSPSKQSVQVRTGTAPKCIAVFI